ncbi:MAG: four helix bundle protein [Ignavibacteriaceae bacterium]|nr:four helix bundle protein [Ignavibacteriaceae bacterium]
MKTKFEDLEIFQLSEKLADAIWVMAISWDSFAKNTVGTQIVNAADGVGSSIAEGSGKGSYRDFRRYVKISRGSLYETKYWLRRTVARKLISQQEIKNIKPLMDELLPKINAFIKYLDSIINKEK